MRPWFTIALLALVGCSAEPPTPSSLVTDSLGIEIVDSRFPVWTADAGWRLGAEPEVVIGIEGSDEHYLFTDVRGARRLPGGRIAVLDAGSYRIRIYDASGRYLTEMGGEGDGPSEFRYPQFLGVVGDSLLLYEYFPARLTWFTANGDFIDRVSVAQPSGGITRAMAFGLLDGRWVVGMGLPTNREFTVGVNRLPLPIWRFDVLGVGLDSLGAIPGFEESISFPRPGTTRHSVHLFGKSSYLAASDHEIFVAASDTYSIQVLDSRGQLRRIIRRWTPSRIVTDEDIDRYMEQRVDAAGVKPEERSAWEESFRDASVASKMPAYRWAQVDEVGNLWVEDWQDVGLGQGPFSVFDADGIWLGQVDVPEGLLPDRGGLFQQWAEIGPDYFLGVWEDDLGVQQVRLYRIEKG